MDWPLLGPGVYAVNDRVGPNDVHYFLGVPKTYDRTTPSPLVIMLPSARHGMTGPVVASGLRPGDHLALTAEAAGGAARPTGPMMLDVVL